MNKLNDLEYLKLGKFAAFMYKLKLFLFAIPVFFKNIFIAAFNAVKNFFIGVKDECVDIGTTFVKGNWAVKLSFLIFGFGNLYYGQIMRGLLFLFFEAIFIGYMLVPSGGAYWLSKVNWFQTGETIGTVQGGFKETIQEVYGMQIVTKDWVPGDDSVKVLLYGLLTVIFIVAFIWTWRLQVKQCRICMDITAQGKRIKSGKDDLRSLLDDEFHKTLLALSPATMLLTTATPTCSAGLAGIISMNCSTSVRAAWVWPLVRSWAGL